MADPITAMTVISLGASAAGAGVAASGSLYSGEAQSNMYNYQAGVAQLNKKIADQNADYARKVGEVDAQQSGLKTAAQISQTRADQGASGIDVNTGSAKRVQESELEIGQENQAIVRANAARRAYGFEVEGLQDTAQGNLLGTAAKTSITSGEIGATSSILGGAASVASKWTQASSAGAFGGSGLRPQQGAMYWGDPSLPGFG